LKGERAQNDVHVVTGATDFVFTDLKFSCLVSSFTSYYWTVEQYRQMH
jgi:hypothetical protein